MKKINFLLLLILVNIFFSGCDIENGSDANSSFINISLKGNKKIYLNLGNKFNDPGATSISKVDGNISDLIKVSDINSSTIGEKNVIYSVIDSSGRSATAIRKVIVEYNKTITPYDTNTIFDKDEKYVYFANPEEEEGGLNSVVRIDYKNMKKDKEVFCVGKNPHSIDRAGDSNKFYVRTQDSNSFDVVNFETGTVEKTVEIKFKNINLKGTNPRSIGAYNSKYHLQLLTGKHRPIIALIDTTTDNIINIVGDSNIYNQDKIFDGHAFWFNEDYFGIIRALNKCNDKYIIALYKVYYDDYHNIKVKYMQQKLIFETKIHTVERDLNPRNLNELRSFYAFGFSMIKNKKYYPPYITEIIFNPKLGVIKKGRKVFLNKSIYKNGNLPFSHHGRVTSDHKYIVAPISDGKIYFIDRKSMKIARVIDSGYKKGLGAGHIEFSKKLKLGIVTNHHSNYLTILDVNSDNVNNYKILTQIKISEDIFNQAKKYNIQPHFAILSKDERYFYTADSHNGKFIRVDLKKIKDIINKGGIISNNIDELIKEDILKIIDIGGVIEQSHS